MTVRELLGVLRYDYIVEVYEQKKRILRINTIYKDAIKEELLDREIYNAEPGQSSIKIWLKPKGCYSEERMSELVNLIEREVDESES